jgi:hypothetical protein
MMNAHKENIKQLVKSQVIKMMEKIEDKEKDNYGETSEGDGFFFDLRVSVEKKFASYVNVEIASAQTFHDKKHPNKLDVQVHYCSDDMSQSYHLEREVERNKVSSTIVELFMVVNDLIE